MNDENTTKQERQPQVGSDDLLGDLELVSRQLACVQHLCEAVADLARCNERMLPLHALKAPFMVDNCGRWSARTMEWLGDLLSGMDAVDEDEAKRWAKTFEDAHARKWQDSTPNPPAPSSPRDCI